MTPIKFAVSCLCTLFLSSCAGAFLGDIEEPSYSVLKADGPIEIREYESMIIAEVRVSGEKDKALNEGFRQVADYIFGNNTAQSSIAMTAPVGQNQAPINETIAMTAPVGQQQDQSSSQELWRVHFVMPSQYTLDTLPTPNNPNVELKQIPVKTFAAIRFSGTRAASNLNDHEAQLKAYLDVNALKALSAPSYAYYDPPWTLPFLRRNEILIEIKAP